MKKVLFFIVISLWTLTHISGQEFGTPDSEWVYDYSGGHSYGVTKLMYSKDTLIRRRLVSVFIKEAYRYSTLRDSFVYFPEPIYLHSRNGIVEFSTDKINFDTLYNYNAKIGQSWMIYRHDFPTLDDSMRITILDTFTTFISNVKLFTQRIEVIHIWRTTGTYSYIDTVYEQIGGRWTYIFPFDIIDTGVDGGEGGFLRCFKNDELGVVEFYSMYQSDYEYDCDNLTSTISPIEMENAYNIYPNPVLNELNVESEYNDLSTLQIIDITGQVIRTTDIMLGLNTLDVSSIPSGYYMILINGKMVGKVVK